MPATTSLPDVTDASFAAAVLESDAPVLVDSTAARCPPCRVTEPILGDRGGPRRLRIVSLDVDANLETVARYGVMSMPTFGLVRGGVPVLRLVGARPRKWLERELAEVL